MRPALAAGRGIVAGLVVVLAGCGSPGEPTRFIGPVPAPEAVPAAFAPPQQLPPRPPSPQRRSGAAGVAAIAAANQRARTYSTREGFVAAQQFFEWSPGALYQVMLAPGYVTTLMLAPGEDLVTVAAGDTLRWQISRTRGGNGQMLVMIKPLRPNIHTNMVLTTAARTYFLELHSLVEGAPYNAAIAWNYPEDTITAEPLTAAVPGPEGVELGYSIEVTRGPQPDWLPEAVFVQGGRTYIRFPARLGAIPAPPLFAIAPDGSARLVNYRVNGRHYEIDRPLAVAELRLGTDPETVVHIERRRPAGGGGRPDE